MDFLADLKQRISPERFSLLALGLAAFLFVVFFPAILWLRPGYMPREMAPVKSHYDFVQYYIGAEIVKFGIWDAMYPTEKPDVYTNPPDFTPYYKTFLYDPGSINGNLAFYPNINLPSGSDVSPKLIARFPPSIDSWRFIYPPPTALLLWPLSWLSLETAGGYVWPTLCLCSYFIVAFLSSRIYRHLHGSISYAEGLIAFACIFYVFRGRTDLSTGNVTPILSALITFATYSLLKQRFVSFSCALIPLVLFKTLGLTWLPILVLNRKYWKSLVYLLVFTIFLNGIVLYLAGLDIYFKFFSIISKICIPAGVGIVSTVLHDFGVYPHTVYLLINLTCLGLLYYGYWRNALQGAFFQQVKEPSLYLPSLLAGTMALFCLINFSVWFTYTPSYLFLPFLGWILQEGHVAQGHGDVSYLSAPA